MDLRGLLDRGLKIGLGTGEGLRCIASVFLFVLLLSLLPVLLYTAASTSSCYCCQLMLLLPEAVLLL